VEQLIYFYFSQARSGAIAIPSLSWSTATSSDETENDIKHPDVFSNWTRKRLRLLETNALRHLEFLLVYYSVQVPAHPTESPTFMVVCSLRKGI
jgi:hypothetical protein